MYAKLNRLEQIIFDVLSIFLVLFYSWSAIVQPMATQYHRGIYVIITYILVFLLYKSKSLVGRIIDYVLILLSIFSIGYWIFNFEVINYRIGAETTVDMVFAIIGVLIGIELARRVVGNVFVIMGALMLIYGVYGYKAPDLISHAGAPFTELCVSIFY
ncbi:MAG TPA: TRAP transporter permease, partial [Desulfobacter sp.]|nr:TRAP transporter permease [Desulfobacter sp.]